MTECRFLFSNGAISSSADVPPVATFLQSHTGAYTTTRTHSDGACILFWERHLRRLSSSVRIILSRKPQLLFKSDKLELGLSPTALDSAVKSLVNEAVGQVLPIALREVRRKDGEELAITALISGNNTENLSGRLSVVEMLNVYVHVGGFVPPAFGGSGTAARLAVVGRGRSVAEAKYSDWVRLRKPLERLRPPSVTELLLSNDGDHVLEGCITNFFVVCRRVSHSVRKLSCTFIEAHSSSIYVLDLKGCSCFQEDKGGGENAYPFEVQTAPVSDGVLPGVIRQLVIEVCLSKGISVQEVAPSWSKREVWQEAFVTNGLRIVQHVEKIQVPCSWESLEQKSVEEITWEEKQFETNPGMITSIIQNEIMKKAGVEGNRNGRMQQMAENPGSPAGGSHDSGGEHSPHSGVREQDRYLPIANISRIMKKALPANGKIAKDAKDTVQECVSEFISFITSEASDKCQKEKRKTINGDDLLWAMATLGFEDYIDPLKAYLARFREGDAKGSGRGGDGSAKRDPMGGNGMPAPNTQAQGQHMIVPSMHGNE
ncbi:Nuclear transcription factor Y subunit B-8 [Linum perenne]